MIEVSQLTHAFGKNLVLNAVDFKVNDGTIMGLIGINGAGKSTLLRLLSGIYRPQKGSIAYDGKSPSDPKVRADIFFLPDEPYFTRESTGASLSKLYKAFYPNFDDEVFHALMRMFGLNERGKIRSFSKGMRRQTFIALAFAVCPKYLFLDEAFDGLDPLARLKFKDYITEHLKSKGTTVIVSSHSLLELQDFCDEYVMIDTKKIVSSSVRETQLVNAVKYRMAFNEPGRDKDFFRKFGLNVSSIKTESRFVTAIFVGNEQRIEQIMADEVKPVIYEKAELSFEERFISDVQQHDEASLIKMNEKARQEDRWVLDNQPINVTVSGEGMEAQREELWPDDIEDYASRINDASSEAGNGKGGSF